MITSSSVVRPRLGSMTRRAQALVRACHYWREYSACLTGAEESALRARTGDSFPVYEPADQLALNRHWKAEARVGDFAEVIAAIKTDPAVSKAARKTLSLLGGSSLALHGFGPNWRDMGSAFIASDRLGRGSVWISWVGDPAHLTVQYWEGVNIAASGRISQDGLFEGEASIEPAAREGLAAIKQAWAASPTFVWSGWRHGGIWEF